MSKSASQSVDISPLAYRKIVYHSAKYVSSTVIGVLVGTKSQSNKSNTTVTDIIPLVHHWHTLSPMTEAGMALVRSICRMHRPNRLFRSRHTSARLAERSWVCMKFLSVLIKKSPLPLRQPLRKLWKRKQALRHSFSMYVHLVRILVWVSRANLTDERRKTLGRSRSHSCHSKRPVCSSTGRPARSSFSRLVTGARPGRMEILVRLGRPLGKHATRLAHKS